MAVEWTTTTTILRDLKDFANETSWREFVEHFRDPVVRFAKRIGADATDAEDIAQETLLDFAKAYRDGRYDRTKGRLSAWLFGIAYRRSMRHMRSDAKEVRRRVADGDAALAMIPDERAATTIWDQGWREFVLERCVRQARQEFQPDLFRAFDLVVGKGLSPADAAKELEVPVKQVYNAKHRILTRVRELRTSFEAPDEPSGYAEP